MAVPKESITVRLPAAELRELERRAKARDLTRVAYLRILVADALADTEREEREAMLRALVDAVHDLKYRLGRATAGILRDLQTTTKADRKNILTAQEIESWISKNVLG